MSNREQESQPKVTSEVEGLLESKEDAQRHRQERGEEEPKERGAMALGRHYDIGGVGDYGPVDTERMSEPDTRDIEARVP